MSPIRIAALVSGGKDSCYALWWALSQGWEICNLVACQPQDPESWLFHVPNVDIILPLMSKAVNIPLVLIQTPKGQRNEEIALLNALRELEIDGFVTGGLSSEYQRTVFERIGETLGVRSYAPLWHLDPGLLLREMIESGFEIILTGVSAMGLDERWLGRMLTPSSFQELQRIAERFGIHIGGEGGEYESAVLDAPFFNARIKILAAEKKWTGDSGQFIIHRATLHPKPFFSQKSRMQSMDEKENSKIDF